MFEKLFKPASISEDDASQSKAAERQQQLSFEMEQIQGLTDQDQLLHAAVSAAFSQARQAAAEKLHQEAQLHRAEKESRDKSVQHIVREKLKGIKQQQQTQQQAQQDLETLCAKMEQLGKSTPSPLFKAQHQHLLDAWNQLDSELHSQLKATLQTRFDQAHALCQNILDELAAEAEKWEAVRKADEAAQQQAEQHALAQKAAEQNAKASAEEAKQQQLSEKEAHDKQQSLLERSLLEQITAIEKNLEQGIISNISKKIAAVQKKLDSLDTALAKQHEGKVQLLKSKLLELKDWQSFAALPKKQELCEKMQKLAEQPLDAPAQAQAIKELQAHWRELKGGGNDEEQKLWERFKETSDKAYEVCKAHFDQQKELRAENLRQREKVCAELEHFNANYHWDTPDWKAVDKILETAKNEFFRLSPIDHKEQDAIKKRYSAATAPLIEKIRPEQKKNEAERQRLIDLAKKLLESPDLSEAIEQAKSLQQQWKEIGLSRPREGQKLWLEFREACDAIFNRRKQARDEFKEQLGQDLQNAESLCEQIEKLAALPDAELQKSKASYQELRQSFMNMKQLRKDKQKKLFSRFYQACDRYQEQMAGIKKRQQNASLAASFELAKHCDQLEHGINEHALESPWDIERAAPEFRPALEARYQKALAISQGKMPSDHKTAEKQRRLILIQLEILQDKQSPAEDKALRMEYQLQQLSNKGMTGKTLNKKEQQEALTAQWLGCAAPELSTLEGLQKRFEALIG